MGDRCKIGLKAHITVTDEHLKLQCVKRPHGRGLHIGLAPEGAKDAKVYFFAEGRLATQDEIAAEIGPLAGPPDPPLGGGAPPAAPAAPVVPSSIESPRPVAHSGRDQALLSGFTGEACTKCQSMKVIRTGTCGTCTDCGETTSCG